MDSTTVLLVDDEPAFLELMGKRLEMAGIRVRTAAGGRAGLAVLAECPEVDVVLLDVHMPEMDGIRVLREIRRAYPQIGVIMLSGRTTIESATEGMRLGAFDYLIKPCPTEQILSRIQEAARNRKRPATKTDQAGRR